MRAADAHELRSTRVRAQRLDRLGQPVQRLWPYGEPARRPIPDDVEAVLAKNMPEQMSPLAGKLLVNPNETYTISFAGVKPGAYDYFCSPHVAMNMKGVITVQ